MRVIRKADEPDFPQETSHSTGEDRSRELMLYKMNSYLVRSPQSHIRGWLEAGVTTVYFWWNPHASPLLTLVLSGGVEAVGPIEPSCRNILGFPQYIVFCSGNLPVWSSDRSLGTCSPCCGMRGESELWKLLKEYRCGVGNASLRAIAWFPGPCCDRVLNSLSRKSSIIKMVQLRDPAKAIGVGFDRQIQENAIRDVLSVSSQSWNHQSRSCLKFIE